jgi:tetratricopeptide (TPR) repeat protein
MVALTAAGPLGGAHPKTPHLLRTFQLRALSRFTLTAGFQSPSRKHTPRRSRYERPYDAALNAGWNTRELLEQALAAEVDELGEEHFTVAITMANLGLVFKDLEDYAGARGFLEKAINLALQFVSDCHPSVATWKANLAMVLVDLGDVAESSVHAEDAARMVQTLPVGSSVRTAVEQIVAHVRRVRAQHEGSESLPGR